MSGNPLWAFSTRVYQRDSVQHCLLELQDSHAADINILLSCCWLATKQQLLDKQQLALLQDNTAQWQLACIQPIRTARRFLKAQSTTLYQQAKALELAVEHTAQERLWSCIVGELNPATASGSTAELALRNLNTYTHLLPGRTEALAALLEQLVVVMDFE